MRDADVSPRENEVFDVFRDQTAKRNAPRARRRVIYRRMPFGVVKSLGEMVVHRPAGIGDNIGKFSSGFDVVLRDDMLSLIAPALALSGAGASGRTETGHRAQAGQGYLRPCYHRPF